MHGRTVVEAKVISREWEGERAEERERERKNKRNQQPPPPLFAKCESLNKPISSNNRAA